MKTLPDSSDLKEYLRNSSALDKRKYNRILEILYQISLWNAIIIINFTLCDYTGNTQNWILLFIFLSVFEIFVVSLIYRKKRKNPISIPMLLWVITCLTTNTIICLPGKTIGDIIMEFAFLSALELYISILVYRCISICP